MEVAEKVSRKALLLEKLLAFDRQEAPADGKGWLAGVDEAGRGPLAGPVVAAAVILVRPETLAGINDSKKLSAERREELYVRIARTSIVGIGFADEKQIDELNIYEATRLAMKKAVLSLSHTPASLLIDGPMRLSKKALFMATENQRALPQPRSWLKSFVTTGCENSTRSIPPMASRATKGTGPSRICKRSRKKAPLLFIATALHRFGRRH